MADIREGLANIKTTTLAVIIFIVSLIPDLITVLTNFSQFLVKLQEVLNGDIWSLMSLKSLALSLFSSIVLVYSRDWKAKRLTD